MAILNYNTLILYLFYVIIRLKRQENLGILIRPIAYLLLPSFVYNNNIIIIL